MRLTSNKESVARGEVSVLAIIETLLAIALVFYLSTHFNTRRWLAVAMCVSPLLLLRTEKSTQLGIQLFDLSFGWLRERAGSKSAGLKSENKSESSGGLMFLVAITFWTVFNLGTLLIRVGATLTVAVREPMAALRAIPKNWARVSLSMDSFVLPELVPEHPSVTFGFLVQAESVSERVSNILYFGPLFLPALLYRWSLKATSIIYAPLVFVAHSTFREGTDLRTKLELIKRGDLGRIRAAYGVVAIAAFLVKVVLMMKWSAFAAWWNGNPISEFVALYVAPAEIPKWQIAGFANSVLAVGAMFFARHALLRYDIGQPLPEKSLKQILGFISGLRWVLAIYAILCVGYITMREAQHWHWPALGEKWLPW